MKKKPQFSRFLPPGTKVIVNDGQRINCNGEIIQWAYEKHPLYGHAEKALVKMTYFGNIVVLSHFTLSDGTIVHGADV